MSHTKLLLNNVLVYIDNTEKYFLLFEIWLSTSSVYIITTSQKCMSQIGKTKKKGDSPFSNAPGNGIKLVLICKAEPCVPIKKMRFPKKDKEIK